jgi:hypothetical protein
LEPAEFRVGKRLDARADQGPTPFDFCMDLALDERLGVKLIVGRFAPGTQPLQAVVDSDEAATTCPQRTKNRSV